MTKRRMLAAIVVVAACIVAVPPARAQEEGLKVRGHWTIDVKQADGTLISHSEFDNALVTAAPSGITAGDQLLVSLLGRTQSLSSGAPWVVYLGSLGSSTTLLLAEPTGVAPPVSLPTQQISMNLTARVVPTPMRLELAGSITAPADISIPMVGTLLWPCAGPGSFCTPTPSSTVEFTRHLLATPIAVQQGQIVQVTVRISFS